MREDTPRVRTPQVEHPNKRERTQHRGDDVHREEHEEAAEDVARHRALHLRRLLEATHIMKGHTQWTYECSGKRARAPTHPATYTTPSPTP